MAHFRLQENRLYKFAVLYYFNRMQRIRFVSAIRAGSSFESKRLARTALLSVVSAIGIPLMTASAQAAGALFTEDASISFTSTGEINCGYVTPADQAIAVGDTTAGVLHAINVCLGVYTKNGVLQTVLNFPIAVALSARLCFAPRCSAFGYFAR